MTGFRSNLSEQDKQVLFHKHEMNRARFFNNKKEFQHHKQELSKLTK